MKTWLTITILLFSSAVVAQPFEPGKVHQVGSKQMVLLQAPTAGTYYLISWPEFEVWLILPGGVIPPGPTPPGPVPPGPVPPGPVPPTPTDLFLQIENVSRSAAAKLPAETQADKGLVAGIYSSLATTKPHNNLQSLLNATRGQREIALGPRKAALWQPWVNEVGTFLDANRAKLAGMDDYYRAWAAIAKGLTTQRRAN